MQLHRKLITLEFDIINLKSVLQITYLINDLCLLEIYESLIKTNKCFNRLFNKRNRCCFGYRKIILLIVVMIVWSWIYNASSYRSNRNKSCLSNNNQSSFVRMCDIKYSFPIHRRSDSRTKRLCVFNWSVKYVQFVYTENELL